MDVWHWCLLMGGAVLAGTVNTIAGGGSLLTVPLLMLVGLTPNVANGTNRIAVLVQSCVAAGTFHRKGLSGIGLGLKLMGPGLAGAIVGAYLATIVSDEFFKTIFALIMLPMAVAIFLRPKKAAAEPTAATSIQHQTRLMIIMVPVGIYTGFVQAGVGILLLAALSGISGLTLRYGNAVKVFLVAGFTAVSLIVFAARLDLEPAVGLLLAMGTGLGGYLGSLATIRQGETWIRWVVFLVCAALAIRLLFG